MSEIFKNYNENNVCRVVSFTKVSAVNEHREQWAVQHGSENAWKMETSLHSHYLFLSFLGGWKTGRISRACRVLSESCMQSEQKCWWRNSKTWSELVFTYPPSGRVGRKIVSWNKFWISIRQIQFFFQFLYILFYLSFIACLGIVQSSTTEVRETILLSRLCKQITEESNWSQKRQWFYLPWENSRCKKFTSCRESAVG